jgi:hypothetical protein
LVASNVINPFQHGLDHSDNFIGFFFDSLSVNGQAPQRDVHNLIERKDFVESSFRSQLVERWNQHRGIDGAAVQCRITGRTAADLKKRNILFRIHAVLPQNHDRFTVRSAAKTADAELFALEIFNPFYVRARHQVMVRTVHHRHDDAHGKA